jgi:hypothetical protein
VSVHCDETFLISRLYSGSIAQLGLCQSSLFLEDDLLLLEMTDCLQSALLLMLSNLSEDPGLDVTTAISSTCKALRFFLRKKRDHLCMEISQVLLSLC